MSSKTAAAVEVEPSRPLPQGLLQRAEHARNLYRLILPAKTRYADLLTDDAARIVDPIAFLLTRGDVIEVIDAAGTFYAQLLLAELVPAKQVRFVELLKVPLGSEALDDMHGTGRWRSAWGGWDRGYCLVAPNGRVTREGMRTRAEADADAHHRNAPNAARGTFA